MYPNEITMKKSRKALHKGLPGYMHVFQLDRAERVLAHDFLHSDSFIVMFSKLAPHPLEKTPMWAPLMEWVIRLLRAFTSST